jgi:cytochrome c biogenesis protein ResB
MKRPALIALTAHFGSLRHTLALVALLAAVVMLSPTGLPLAIVIGLLVVNLLAALLVHPAFRRQLPLLVAHLALLALVVGVAVGRLTALDGHFELTQGESFDGTLQGRDAGALHVDRLARLSFRHDGFEIDYAPGRRRGATRNAVTWRAADGQPRSAVIGDHHPLVLEGHRFYTSPNKGYAPLLRWVPEQGQPVLGAVHLPSFPAQELQQSREWALPDGREVWVLLQFDETLIDPAQASRFSMPVAPRLVVRVGQTRAELAPGQGLALAGGTLVFEELRTWMGYRVAYDPTLPWLLVAALLAALALAVHYALKFTTRSAAVPRALAGAVDG